MKFIWIVLGIVIIGGGVTGWYFLAGPGHKTATTSNTTTSTTSDTSDWLTYNNTQYGFSFKYPPVLKVETGAQGYDATFANFADMLTYTKANWPADGLGFYLKEYYQMEIDNENQYLIKEENINGVTVRFLGSIDAPKTFSKKTAKFTAGGKTFKLSYTSEISPALMTQEQNYFDKIVQTVTIK